MDFATERAPYDPYPIAPTRNRRTDAADKIGSNAQNATTMQCR
jgi:hypothetical protein